MSDEKKKVYGIDLGTTYSALAYVNEFNQAEIIPNSDNERVTPSVIFFESPSNIVVGTTAKDSAKTDAERVVDFVKRQMGTNWTFHYNDVDYKPEELSSYIVRRLVEDARKIGEHDVRDVVITCPAYFGDAERNATRLAGELAGLNVLHILDEPAAAALHYGLDNLGERKTAVVYDLGGGTFDVSVISIDQNEIKIICTDGDHRLGGKNWDDAIVSYLVSEFESEFGTEDNILDDHEASFDLRVEAEKAKRALSKREKTTVRVASRANRKNVELTRETFEALTNDLVERTLDFTRNALALAKSKGVEKIDAFLLVGGSTRMPMIARRVTETFAAELECEPQEFEVDEAVAKGAARFGQIQNIKVLLDQAASELDDGLTFNDLDDEQRNQVLDQVSSDVGVESSYLLESAAISITTVATKSYGIRAKKDGVPIVHNLILRQTPTPTVGEQVFKTEDADAEYIELRVFSNNIDQPDAQLEESVEIGQTTLELPPGLPAQSPVRVSFKLSSEGKLDMEAVEETSGGVVRASFAADVGMSEQEIEEARERSRDLTIE